MFFLYLLADYFKKEGKPKFIHLGLFMFSIMCNHYRALLPPTFQLAIIKDEQSRDISQSVVILAMVAAWTDKYKLTLINSF